MPLQFDDETATTADGPAQEVAAQPPPKRFKFAARPQHDREGERSVASTKENDLNLYLMQLCTLPEETNALEYWLLKESQYPSISKIVQDFVSAPSSQAYVETGESFFQFAVISLLGNVTVPVLV